MIMSSSTFTKWKYSCWSTYFINNTSALFGEIELRRPNENILPFSRRISFHNIYFWLGKNTLPSIYLNCKNTSTVIFNNIYWVLMFCLEQHSCSASVYTKQHFSLCSYIRSLAIYCYNVARSELLVDAVKVNLSGRWVTHYTNICNINN